MSWRLALYDSEEASKAKIITLNLLVIITILCGYGYWTDFVPSPEWAEIGFNLSVAATILSVSTYYFALATGYAKFQPKTSTPIKLLTITTLPFLALFVFVVAITHGFGDIATQALGHEAELTVELSKEQQQSRKGCNYRLKGYAIGNALPSRICVSKAEFGILPQTGEYILQVKQTLLGFHVKNIATAVNR
ncbi:MAG: hypothetical protein U5M72_03485 [Pseudomonas sp.]|nr:hypothetical protein [Pseudomonas sp.]